MWFLWVLPLGDVTTLASVASPGWNVYFDRTKIKQDGDHIHKELLDGCLLLSEEREAAEKGAQSDREAMRELLGAGFVFCIQTGLKPAAH